jgi:hypothetical protein
LPLHDVSGHRTANPMLAPAVAAFGSDGLRHVKGAGEHLLAQAATIAASGMPSAAIAAGGVDLVLPS